MSWKESSMPPDSSSSETGKDTPPETIKFIVGEGNEQDSVLQSKPSPKEQRTFQEKNISGSLNAATGSTPRAPSPGMVRSYSQDTNMLLSEERPSISSFLSKTSFSENSLGDSDVRQQTSSRFSSLRKQPLKELPKVLSMDDETQSTDSNSTADNDETKRRRRKLHFPAFKKNKTKPT